MLNFVESIEQRTDLQL